MKSMLETTELLRSRKITGEEFQKIYLENHEKAFRGDIAYIDDFLAYYCAEIERTKAGQDLYSYALNLESAVRLAERGAEVTNESSYLEKAVEYAVTLADHFAANEQFDRAADAYPTASRLIEEYRQTCPDGAYAKASFLNGFYARCGLAAQYHAADVMEQESADHENADLIIKRLRQSRAAFEKIQNRGADDTHAYLCTLRMLLEYDPSCASVYFQTLCDLERRIRELDPALHSDLYIKLGEAYESGFGTRSNEKKAVAYIKKAGKAGNADAKDFYSDLQREKRIASVQSGEYAVRSRGSFLFELIVYGILFIAGVILPFATGSFGRGGQAIGTELVSALLIGLVISGIPAGWRTLTRITPKMFLFLPVAGWVVYFLIKGVLSLFIGWAMLPVRITKCVKALRAV